MVDRSTPRNEEDVCACVGLIYFRGTQTARAAFCSSIASISRRRSEGELKMVHMYDVIFIAPGYVTIIKQRKNKTVVDC